MGYRILCESWSKWECFQRELEPNSFDSYKEAQEEVKRLEEYDKTNNKNPKIAHNYIIIYG